MHKEEKLFRIAELQQGFFTAKQAVSAGYERRAHSRMVQSRRWVRVDRGLYRLYLYPVTERPDLMQWYLWSRDREDRPQGAFSHRTALDLYDLTDDMPVKLEMTVPPTFRRASPTLGPILHKGVVPEADTCHIHGVKVTKPLRTIVDLIVSDFLFGDLLQQAITTALDNGFLISRKQILDHPRIRADQALKVRVEEVA